MADEGQDDPAVAIERDEKCNLLWNSADFFREQGLLHYLAYFEDEGMSGGGYYFNVLELIAGSVRKGMNNYESNEKFQMLHGRDY